MKKPNFFIIGAPKCGTTALAYWLSQHPDVFFSPRKEPHFFNTDGLTGTKSLTEYETLFINAPSDCSAVGEGSTNYLYSRTAIPNILEYAPDARFIVCLRNPLEMAPALHGERLSQGRETETRFQYAWRLQHQRSQGLRIPATVAAEPYRLLYGDQCRLGKHLQRVYSMVAQERVHTMLLDDIRTAPEAEYKRVLTFLGLSKDQIVDFLPVNTATRTKSAAIARAVRRLATVKKKTGIKASFSIARTLKSINTSSRPRKPFTKELYEELKQYFESDIHALSSLLDRDLTVWLRAND